MISRNKKNIHEDTRGKLISLSGKLLKINIKRTFIIYSKKPGLLGVTMRIKNVDKFFVY